MMIRRVVSLTLIVQVLLTQLLQCHCHAAPCDEGRHGAATPHIHVPSLASHDHSHGTGHHHHHHRHGNHDHGHGNPDAAPDEAGPMLHEGHPSHDHDSGAVYLAHGLVGDRASNRLLGDLIDGPAPTIPDYLDRPAGVSRAFSFAHAPPAVDPPDVPLYLRLLTLLV